MSLSIFPENALSAVHRVREGAVALFFNRLTTRNERQLLQAWSETPAPGDGGPFGEGRCLPFEAASFEVKRHAYLALQRSLGTGMAGLWAVQASVLMGGVSPVIPAVVVPVAGVFMVMAERQRRLLTPARDVVNAMNKLSLLDAQMSFGAVVNRSLVRHPQENFYGAQGPKSFFAKMGEQAGCVTRAFVELGAACRRYNRPPLWGASRPPLPLAVKEELGSGGFSFKRMTRIADLLAA